LNINKTLNTSVILIFWAMFVILPPFFVAQSAPRRS
jgi:hypothetical protein